MGRISVLEIAGRAKKMLTGDKWKKYIVLLGVGGMLLIALSGIMGGKEKDRVTESGLQASFDGYEEQIENRLGELIGCISGVGNVRIMVTLEGSGEYVYVNEKKSSSDKSSDSDKSSESSNTEVQTVILSDSQGERALVKTETAPAVKGVVVVCEGGDDPIVQQRVIGAVTTALDISSKRVCVARMSQTEK